MPLRKLKIKTSPDPSPSYSSFPSLSSPPPSKPKKLTARDESSFLPFELPRVIHEIWDFPPPRRRAQTAQTSHSSHASTSRSGMATTTSSSHPNSKSSATQGRTGQWYRNPPASAGPTVLGFDQATRALIARPAEGRPFSPFGSPGLVRAASPHGATSGVPEAEMPSIERVMGMDAVPQHTMSSQSWSRPARSQSTGMKSGTSVAEDGGRRREQRSRNDKRSAGETMRLPIMVPPPSRVMKSRDSDSDDELPASTNSPRPNGVGMRARPQLPQTDTPSIAADEDMVEWEWEAFDSVPPPPTPTSPHPFAPHVHPPALAVAIHPTRSSRSERVSARDAFSRDTLLSREAPPNTQRHSTLTRSSTTTRSTLTYHTGSSRSYGHGHGQSGQSGLSPDPTVGFGAGDGAVRNRPSPVPSFRNFEDWVDPEQQDFSSAAAPPSVADIAGPREGLSVSVSDTQRTGNRGTACTGGVEDLMQQLEDMSGRMLAETYGYDVQRFDPTQRSARSVATNATSSHSGSSESRGWNERDSRDSRDMLSIRSWRDVRKRSKTIIPRPMSEQQKGGSSAYRAAPPPPPPPPPPHSESVPAHTSVPSRSTSLNARGTAPSIMSGVGSVAMSRQPSTGSQLTTQSQYSVQTGYTDSQLQTCPSDEVGLRGLGRGEDAPPVPPRAASRGPPPIRIPRQREGGTPSIISAAGSGDGPRDASTGGVRVPLVLSPLNIPEEEYYQPITPEETLGLPIHLGPLPAVPRTASGSTPSTSSHKPSRSLASFGRLGPKRPSTAPTSTGAGVNSSSPKRWELEGRRIPSLSKLLPHSPRNERVSATTSDRYDLDAPSLGAFHRLERLQSGGPSDSEAFSQIMANGGSSSPLRSVRGREQYQSQGMTALSFLALNEFPLQRDQPHSHGIDKDFGGVLRSESPFASHILPPHEINKIGSTPPSRFASEALPRPREAVRPTPRHLSRGPAVSPDSAFGDNDDDDDDDDTIETKHLLPLETGEELSLAAYGITGGVISSVSPLSPFSPDSSRGGTALSPPPRPRVPSATARAAASTATPAPVSSSLTSFPGVSLTFSSPPPTHDPELSSGSGNGGGGDGAADGSSALRIRSADSPSRQTLLRPTTMGPTETDDPLPRALTPSDISRALTPISPGWHETLAEFPSIPDTNSGIVGQINRDEGDQHGANDGNGNVNVNVVEGSFDPRETRAGANSSGPNGSLATSQRVVEHPRMTLYSSNNSSQSSTDLESATSPLGLLRPNALTPGPTRILRGGSPPAISGSFGTRHPQPQSQSQPPPPSWYRRRGVGSVDSLPLTLNSSYSVSGSSDDAPPVPPLPAMTRYSPRSSLGDSSLVRNGLVATGASKPPLLRSQTQPSNSNSSPIPETGRPMPIPIPVSRFQNPEPAHPIRNDRNDRHDRHDRHGHEKDESASIYSFGSSWEREQEQRAKDRKAMEEWLAQPVRRGKGQGVEVLSVQGDRVRRMDVGGV